MALPYPCECPQILFSYQNGAANNKQNMKFLDTSSVPDINVGKIVPLLASSRGQSLPKTQLKKKLMFCHVIFTLMRSLVNSKLIYFSQHQIHLRIFRFVAITPRH